MDIDLNKTRLFAENLARTVGDYIQNHQDSAKVVTQKDQQDIATNIDMEAEQLVIEAISSQFPTHAIYSEESGSDQHVSDFQWVVDPLDGTKECLRGLPHWNTCFALEYKNEPVLSVVYKPMSRELYSAAKGEGSWLNGHKNTPSQRTQLDQSFVFCYLPTYKITPEQSSSSFTILKEISRLCYRIRGLHEEAMGLSWVASGKIEACLNVSRFPNWYDFVPGFVIAKEAGCVITDLTGNSIEKAGEYHGYLVAPSAIHHELLTIINPKKESHA